MALDSRPCAWCSLFHVTGSFSSVEPLSSWRRSWLGEEQLSIFLRHAAAGHRMSAAQESLAWTDPTQKAIHKGGQTLQEAIMDKGGQTPQEAIGKGGQLMGKMPLTPSKASSPCQCWRCSYSSVRKRGSRGADCKSLERGSSERCQYGRRCAPGNCMPCTPFVRASELSSPEFSWGPVGLAHLCSPCFPEQLLVLCVFFWEVYLLAKIHVPT